MSMRILRRIGAVAKGKTEPERNHMGMSTRFIMPWKAAVESSGHAMQRPSAVSEIAVMNIAKIARNVLRERRRCWVGVGVCGAGVEAEVGGVGMIFEVLGVLPSRVSEVEEFWGVVLLSGVMTVGEEGVMTGVVVGGVGERSGQERRVMMMACARAMVEPPMILPRTIARRETGATSTPWRKPVDRSSMMEMVEKMAVKRMTMTSMPGMKYVR